LAGLGILAAAAPLLLYLLLVELGRVRTPTGQILASQVLFPTLALAAGLLGGFQFLLASRVYFGAPGGGVNSRNGSRPHGLAPPIGVQAESGGDFARAGGAVRSPSPGVLYGLDLAGACAGALALSLLLIPLYGFLRTAVLMAAVNLAPAALAAAAGIADFRLPTAD
jgi:hypothetical protein